MFESKRLDNIIRKTKFRRIGESINFETGLFCLEINRYYGDTAYEIGVTIMTIPKMYALKISGKTEKEVINLTIKTLKDGIWH